MLTRDQVSVTPVEGQWWAILNPLALIKIESGTPDSSYWAKQWVPGSEPGSELVFIMPYLNKETAVHLWYFLSLIPETIHQACGYPIQVRTGDVFERSTTGGLLFVGDPNEFGVNVYSDFEYDFNLGKLRVIQRGPAPSNKEPRTRFERVLDEDNSNIPMVRPLGGDLHRHTQASRLLISNTNTRVEDSAQTEKLESQLAQRSNEGYLSLSPKPPLPLPVERDNLVDLLRGR
mgnify:CR=1 FL=1